MKRHQNALGIMEGARNVRAITRSLAEAAEEAAGEGVGAEHDAAVRLMVHRLARLCNTEEISFGYDTATLTDTYCRLMKECRSRAVEGATVRVVEPAPLLGRHADGNQAPAREPEFAETQVITSPDMVAEVRRGIGAWRSLKERFFNVRSN